MSLSITQLVLTIFLAFALSRVYLRFRGGNLSLFGFLFWTFLFGLAIGVVLFPELTGNIARSAGIGRGADAVIYTSIVLIFYLVFRLYVYLQDIRQEITTLIRKLALKELKKRDDKKTTKD